MHKMLVVYYLLIVKSTVRHNILFYRQLTTAEGSRPYINITQYALAAELNAALMSA